MPGSTRLQFMVRKQLTASFAAILLAAFLSWPSIGHAALGVVVDVQTLPEDMIAGQGGAGSITLTSTNSGVDASVTNVVDMILLTPSCDAQPTTGCISGTEDETTFAIYPLMFGGASEGTCSGITFKATLLDPTRGIWRFTPSATVVLPVTGSFCRFYFRFTALNLPKVDLDPPTFFGQTSMAAAIHFFTSNGQQQTAVGIKRVTIRFGCSLDFDGNGSIDALTDGLLVLRAMFGLTGNSATTGTVAGNARRKTWGQLSGNFNQYCGSNFAP